MPELLYERPGGELSPDSSPSATGPTEAETDRRRSEGLWGAFGFETGGAAMADIPGGIDERRRRCLYVGEPSMTE